MKKKYSTPNLIKVVSLSTVMATLLSSVSPVFAANLAIIGQTNQSSNAPQVMYPYGSHGSVVFAGDDNYCGADNVVGRGGKQQQGIADSQRITAEQQYNRFITNQEFNGRRPYGTTTEQVIWTGDGYTARVDGKVLGGYMGTFSTSGFASAMPEAYGVYSFATGCGSAATGNYSTVFGAGATAKAGGAQAFGVSALASGIASVAMGVGSEASGKSAVSFGGLATASGKNSISIGESSKATQDDAIAVGSNAEGNGINSVAIGKFASASGYDSIALGLKTKATDEYAVAIGTKAEAQALGSIAIGGGEPADNGEERKVIAKGKNSIAIGSHTYAETAHSVAIGINAQVRVIDGVAVGGGSVSRVESGVFGYDPVTNTTTTKSDLAWKSTAGDFSVGNTNQNLTRQITNVAAGTKDTDAVNVAQLKAMRDLASGVWKLSANDTDPTDVNPGSTIDFSVKDTKVGKDNLKIERNTVDNKHKIEFTLSDTLKLTKVTTGQSSMSDDGFIIENGPKMILDGIDAGDKQITNVADGKEDTDAVNYKQLKEVKTVVEKGWKLSVDGNNATDVGAGSTVDLVTGADDNNNKNIKIVKSNGNKVTFTLNSNLSLTSVTAGNSIMNGDGFKFVNGGPSITVNGIDAGNQKIINVAEGTQDTDAVNYKQLKEIKEAATTHWQLSVNGGNGVSIGQNDTVNLQSAGKEGSQNIKIVGDNNRNVTFDLADDINVMTVTAGDSIMDAAGFRFDGDEGPSITVKGIHAGNKTIKGVADGEDDTDAVNFSQLQDVKAIAEKGWKLSVDGNDATDVKAGSTVNFVAVKQKDDDDNESENTNIKIVKNEDNQVSFDLSEYIKVGRVETGDSRMSNAGFMIKDGPNMTKGGINAAKTQIKGVADGSDEHDAVNLSQLYKMKFEIEDNSLVKWSKSKNLITIGAEKEGIEIKVANSEGRGRIISGVAVGKVSFDSTEAINGHQLFNYADNISKYFGGETDVIDGFKPTFTVQDKEHHNVTDAFKDVDNSITDIYTQINNVTENSLVKWDEGQKLITIGAQKDGTKINVANSNSENRVISGIADGNLGKASKEAINGSQINTISGDVAKFFGGEAAFQDGAFVGPQYNVSTVSTDGEVVQYIAENVGDALTKLDANVKNVNSRIKYVDNKFDKFSQDALLWDDGKQAFAARHEKDGRKTDSKITHLLNGDISEDSTDAVNGSQINKISKDIAKYFGGGTEFNNGVFSGPQYNLSTVSTDGKVEQKTFEDVGSALTGLDANIKNVNKHIRHVTNEFDKFSQDALLWSEKDQAFVARHGTDGQKTNSKLTYLLDGNVSEDSTDAINGSQLYAMGDQIANYFGGGARYENGEWSDPTFKVSQRNEDGTIVEKTHHNVADAFEGVDNSITDIYNQINNVTENSLVKQEGEDGLITVGKATGGTEISLVNKDKQERTLSGVKDGELSQTSTQAVNGSQLFATNEKVTTVTDNLKKVAENTSKYFGGSTDVLEGIKPAFLIDGTAYDNVTDAFTGVNISIHKIDDKISDVIKNSLVKQDGGASGVITIGKDTAGTEINIAGVGGSGRKISGVREAENGDEAVNKDQLDKSIDKISKDIETVTAAAVLYDKNDDNSVNYGSVTLGGDNSDGPVALHNVKNGSISENSNDAINGSQINKISADIAKFFGGGAKFINGAFEGLKYTLSAIVGGEVGKANFYNVGDALTGLDKNVQDVNQRLTNVSNEFNQKIEDFSKDALLWDDDEGAFVARHEKDGKKTNSKLKYLLDGEIADGSTDAITGNQLYFMSNQLANYFGGGAKYENGKWTDPTFKIVQVNADGTTVETEHHNVADAFGDVNKNMSNINNRIDDVINKVDSDALKWNDKEKAYDAGRDGKPNKIINVADGKVEKGSKDAVNGGQLWETNERITGVEKDVKHLTNRVDNISNTIADIGDTVINIDAKVDNINNRVDDIEEGAVRYDRDENGKKTNKITLAGGDASEPVLIDNVADGKIEKGSKEAVNGGQLHDYTQEQMKIILDQSKQYTDQRVNNIVIDAIDDAVDRAKQYTDMKFDVLNYSIESVKKEARQAAAIGLAVSNLRYNDTPGKLSVGFGTGLWRSQSAFAFGAGYTSENGKYRSNISATTSGGHWGVGAGFNMTLN
ncbi:MULTISPECIES: Vomp family autotransporter [unclassified Bartonella]|uniref:Vomp family autotransporter n=1 Tax=unclassified Bartonella TaxID=2645622 RepID=UPI0035D0E93A